jgi:enoyl-CoA hydratase/carnithine racemase
LFDLVDTALVDTEVLDDTPIGTLRVIEWGDTHCVAVMRHDDPERVFNIVHTLAPGENPLNAVYGKRLFETPAISSLYDKQAEEREASAQRHIDLVSADFQKAVKRFLAKNEDGREAVAALYGKR